jgi:hypothetical protein
MSEYEAILSICININYINNNDQCITAISIKNNFDYARRRKKVLFGTLHL